MANKQISQLNLKASVVTTDQFGVDDVSSVSWKVTAAQILTFINTSQGFTGGILAMANGGTNANLTAANGAIPYSTATAFALLAAGASGQLFQSGGVGAPAWTVPTYPSASGTAGFLLRSNGTNNVYTTSTFADTYAVSTLLFAGSANAVSGLATANSAMLRTSSTGVPAWSASLTNGQVMIGSTGSTPAPGTLTAGPGISIANAANAITISGTGSGIGWTEVTGTTQAMTADSGYVANNAGLVTLTLPATAAFGTVISVLGKGAGGWLIAQNALQSIQVGNTSSTAGVGGSIASSNRYDSFDMICTTANLVWTMQGAPQGNITIV